LLKRCQDAETKNNLKGAAGNVAQLAVANTATSCTNQVVIELTNTVEQLKSEVGVVLNVRKLEDYVL
jgi:hypothetical protein